ncbi:IS701 family transposase [Streptomyces sp. NPDC056431]|uniref:IS701 family transposase n=1 Tax=Streptomyces sp. NPDC056431 TaxID=3345814 RepID=UPI0036A45498
MTEDLGTGLWVAELEELFLRVGGRFSRVEPRRRMRDYVRGLLGPVGRKNGWQLAESAGHATPDGLQRLLAGTRWDPEEIRDDLQAYVAERLGRPDGVLIIDGTGFLKKGTTSAGVQRQYSGTAGRTENCQIGVFAASASTKGRALVDRELYLPKFWTGDADRCRAAKIPEDRTFATKGELARRLVLRALASDLPIAWVAADCAYGQEWGFRRMLEEAGVGYVLAVPKSQQVKSPAGIWRIDQLISEAPHDAWQRLSAGDGTRAHASTTGLPRSCRSSTSSTAMSAPTAGGYWPAAASRGQTRLPTTWPTRPPAPRLPSWFASPAHAGRSRSGM